MVIPEERAQEWRLFCRTTIPLLWLKQKTTTIVMQKYLIKMTPTHTRRHTHPTRRLLQHIHPLPTTLHPLPTDLQARHTNVHPVPTNLQARPTNLHHLLTNLHPLLTNPQLPITTLQSAQNTRQLHRGLSNAYWPPSVYPLST